ncbi:ATP-dependent helicase [Nocardiopsis ansamitocini]|uniref:DNA 3'-5' helicase n=1 Tax=Nocardiopsis ansamitocini TaxID=1670832 RepID=A0A9W6P474_9ACTN|nr:ATP-dependent DNA helicase [Nocardiopsis ansamitocini]GLU46762.1 ATP-dependent DNA helicase [Nocardiopsis ansamitocini]
MTQTPIRSDYGPAQLARLLGQPEPTVEQSAVISAPLLPGVVVAGAGSGKSETMAGRVVWLVANGHVRPENVLGLTFTRKAAAELSERVRKRLDQLRGTGAVSEEVLDGEPAVSTYHSYAQRLVGDHALREAVEPSTRLISQAVAWQLANRAVTAYGGPMDAVNSAPATVVKDVLALAGELAEHLRTPGDVREFGDWLRGRAEPLKKLTAATRDLLATQRHREQLLPLLEEFARLKSGREVMDFGDQVALAARIAQRHPEVSLIEKSRYHVVLLDEYQDTSHAQLVLLQALFGDGHPVTAVGDPCQSIYGWRGASAGNLTAFPTHFPQRPGRAAPVRQLATSFRNGENVLAVAKRVAEPLREEAEYVPVLYPGPARRARGQVSCALFATETQEAEWIAAQIDLAMEESRATLKAPDGISWPEQEERGRLGYGDVAVLCRKRAQFSLLRKALEARDIPVEVVGLGGLISVPEVRDIIATLRVLHDPTAGDELARLLTGPRWCLGPRDLVALNKRAVELAGEARRDLRGERAVDPGIASDPLRQTVLDLTAETGSLVDALDDLGPEERYSATGHARLNALAAELRSLRAQAAQPLPDLITDVERTLVLDIEVGARPGRDQVAARADLDAFIDTAARFVGTSDTPTLSAFLAFLHSAEDTERGLAPGERVGSTDTVKLMTVHAAKGLQWPMVVVPGLSAGVFPTNPGTGKSWTGRAAELPFPLRGDRAGLPALTDVAGPDLKRFQDAEKRRDTMEERRLAYVAVTRASFALVCTGYHWALGSRNRRAPSVFLEEIREVCEAGHGRVVHWEPTPGDDEANPQLADQEPVSWPRRPEDYRDAQAAQHERMMAAADLVERAKGESGQDYLGVLDRAAMKDSWRRRLHGWERDTELLLRHRDAEQPGDGTIPVELPAHLTVSSLVSLARDPAGLARQIRRPLPRPPAPHTRRGTAFHTWMERRFGQQSVIDPDELPGAADETAGRDAGLDELQRLFEASEWGERTPLEVEVPFETIIGDRLIRGRMDAVFHDAESGRYDVVDWKTGHPPTTARERSAVAVQLAAYRIAWAQLVDTDLDQVRAAFHYVRAEETVRPADLLDADGLAALIAGVPERD